MTGLNLETFLRLLRADLGAWASLGVVAAILAVMTWTSWGSRRALRKCLFLSIAAHVGLIVYGSTSPAVLKLLRLDGSDRKPPRADRPVRVTPWVAEKPPTGPDGRPTRKDAPAWDQDRGRLALAEPSRLASPPTPAQAPTPPRAEPGPIAPEPVAPEVNPPLEPPSIPPPVAEARAPEPPPGVAPGEPSEVAAPVAALAGSADVPAPSASTSRLRPEVRGPASAPALPDRLRPSSPTLPEAPDVDLPAPKVASRPVERVPSTSTAPRVDIPPASPDDLDPGPPGPALPIAAPAPAPSPVGPDIRRAPRPSREAGRPELAPPSRLADTSAPPALARVTPTAPSNVPAPSPRPDFRRSLSEVPPVYRSRLDPNRTALAQRAGASLASEQAVERALDWLARHQDADGKWNAASSRRKDGSVIEYDSFTLHCPPGEVCFGECYYWEADTALTGLSLLAFLGAGYTHVDGKYATVVRQGLEFLGRSQKADGDLRGSSLAVGMYCHSMATLALCEAYALTGDARLRGPVERAVGFLVRSRAKDGMAWRYAPGAATGDTSILGWAVMALKSAKTVGIPIPSATQAGILGWLREVDAGRSGGLARYQPGEANKVTPTMTAEAWACRQFLEVGGPGAASDEAAAFLLRSPSDRGEYNIYYLYYGTLAMYQHGGEAWSTWNARVRDEVVRRQRAQGHMAGSWDPDDSPYGTHGGRIYGTALATLTLEVYYRFLRLYDAPAAPMAPGDGGARRAGFDPAPAGR